MYESSRDGQARTGFKNELGLRNRPVDAPVARVVRLVYGDSPPDVARKRKKPARFHIGRIEWA